MRLATLALVIALSLLVPLPQASAQTFVFGAQGEPVQLDPAVITDGISSRITRQIYDGLVRYKGATTEVEPALAEKWEVSGDGRVWTFQLRRGVKFHDGNPLDAAAVVWNFERWWKAAHPQHDNQIKAGQTFEYWEGQFGGFDDKSVVSAVAAAGTHTVRITLKEPQAPFLANLAMFVFDIASPKAVERWGTEFGKHPVGTGAYKFVEWKPNQEVILEANADYWGVKPKIKRVVVRNIKDNSQRLGALKAGEIHGMEGLNPDDVSVVKSDANLQLLLRPTNTTGYIAFNYKVKEFQDKRVRQAFAHAINKRGIVEALYGGTGLVATQFQPPALWGYNRELKDYEYSASQAQALLRDAGLSGSEYAVLVELSHSPDGVLRARELGSELGWDRSRLSHLVGRMEKRRLVAREECEEDARGSMVRLTDAGRATVDGVAPEHSEAIRRYFFNVLSKHELETFATVVDRLRVNFELDESQIFRTDGPVNLSRLMNRFHGDLRLVAAAYYAGEHVVDAYGLGYANPDVVIYVASVRERMERQIRLRSAVRQRAPGRRR